MGVPSSRKVAVLSHLLSSPLSLPRGPLPRWGPTDLHPEACGPSQHLRPSPSSQHTGWTPQATPAAASALPSLRPQEPPEPLCFKPAGQERDFQQISSIPDSGLGQTIETLGTWPSGSQAPSHQLSNLTGSLWASGSTPNLAIPPLTFPHRAQRAQL